MTRTLASSALLLALVLGGCAASRLQDPTVHERALIRNLGPNVNSDADDYAPDMHGDRLIFTSKRPTVEGYIQGDDLWFADRERGGWSKALNLGGAINSERDEGSAHVVPEGDAVYFIQCETTDGLGDADIYQASYERRGMWQNVRNLGDGVNTKYWDSHPYLTPDGDELYFASDRPGGYGGTDLWVSKRMRNGKWGPARNLGPVINTSGDEKAPTVAPDGTLFFASTGHPGLGGYDLFLSRDLGRKGWAQPVNAGLPFNSAWDDLFFRLSAEEDTVYISSNREGGSGGLDLYLVAPNPFKDTTRYIYYLAGTVYDSVSTMGIKDASLSVTRAGETMAAFTTDRSGRFKLTIKPGDEFEIRADAAGYESRSLAVKVPQRLTYSEYRRSLALPPLAVADTSSLPSDDADLNLVFFDFDKASLRADAERALDVLFNGTLKPLLDASAEFEVRLDAHTDDRGTEAYNVSLSRLRGAAVSRYLASRGVPLSSIVVNAYGESTPAGSNESEEGRQSNRRVEIRVKRSMEK